MCVALFVLAVAVPYPVDMFMPVLWHVRYVLEGKT